MELETRQTSSLDIISKLRQAFPQVQYQKLVGTETINLPGGNSVVMGEYADGEPKLKITLAALDTKEAHAGMQAIRKIFEGDEGITFNGGLTATTAINIPVRLLDQLNEAKATELTTLIKGAMENSLTRTSYKSLLEKISGTSVSRTADFSKDDPRPCYTMSYSVDGYTDPIKHIHEAMNKALGENIFSGITMDDGRHHLLVIDEENMPKFLKNPNRAETLKIFHNPEAECTEFRKSTFVGRLESAYDKATGHERKEKSSYQPMYENNLALPEGFTRRTPDEIIKLGKGNTTNIGPSAT